MAFDIHPFMEYTDNQNISVSDGFEKDKMISSLDTV